MSTQTLKYIILLSLLFISNLNSAYLQVWYQDYYAFEDVQERISKPQMALSLDLIINDISGEQVNENLQIFYDKSIDKDQLNFKTSPFVKKSSKALNIEELSIDLGGVEIMELSM